MKHQLYDYQIDLENSTRGAFKKGFSSVIVALPTGGGKTVCFSNITYNSLKNNCKVLICTDRSEIAKGSDGSGGTVGTLFGFGIDAPGVHNGLSVNHCMPFRCNSYPVIYNSGIKHPLVEDIENVFIFKVPSMSSIYRF